MRTRAFACLGRSFDKKRFAHISGNKAARTDLIRALGTMTSTRFD
jgi:hypothetical protein